MFSGKVQLGPTRSISPGIGDMFLGQLNTTKATRELKKLKLTTMTKDQ